MSDAPARLRTSRYNFAVRTPSGPLVYNASSGAVQQLAGPDADALAAALTGPPAEFPADAIDPAFRSALVDCSFLVPADRDEVAVIRDRFRRARDQTPAVLTVTTTMDCNLGCYYCYEERSGDRLTRHDVGGLVAVARDRLRADEKTALHVDWYGGEPLLNVEFLEEASAALRAFCDREGVAYRASVISNGTRWPDDVGGFVRRHRIGQVQVTFDGLRANHDRRRRYRAGRAGPGASSFDAAVRLVTRLLDHARVDVRFNLDRRNRGDLLPFARLARSLGWFTKPHPATLQPARLAAYSERTRFMRKAELALAEFDALKAALRAEVAGEAAVEESEAPDGFPHPKTTVCAALATGSVVVGADRRLYRCGLQVGEAHRAVGRVAEPARLALPMAGDHPDAGWWDRFDPTALPSCSRCSFLPVCWGGCPKKHLEGDSEAIAQQGAYWRANLPRLIAAGVGAEPIGPAAYTEADQFRG